MSTPIPPSEFTKGLLAVLTEAFEAVCGFFLDPHTSLFETLSEITASEASIPLGHGCATITAQVAHVNFYMEVLERYLQTGESEPADWGQVWRTVQGVTPGEWDASLVRLKQTYQRLRRQVEAYDRWETEDSISGTIALVAHSAYHLGEIRQATCTVKQLGGPLST